VEAAFAQISRHRPLGGISFVGEVVLLQVATGEVVGDEDSVTAELAFAQISRH
jgi:hypothetical protein